MSFYNTGNPVPSIDPRDLDDNAKHVDELVNSTFPTFTDRLGTARKTLAGIEADVAPAVTLRSDLAEDDGATLVGFQLNEIGAVVSNVAIAGGEYITTKQFGAIGDKLYHPLSEMFPGDLAGAQAHYSNVGVTSLTQSIDWAATLSAVKTGKRVIAPKGNYVIAGGTIVVDDGQYLFGVNTDQWDTVFGPNSGFHPYYLKKDDNGTSFYFYGTGPKTYAQNHMSKCLKSGGVKVISGLSHELLDFTNQDSVAGAPATPKMYSVGIKIYPEATVENLRILPWSGATGLDGYEDPTSTALAADWDVGIDTTSAWRYRVVNVQAVGYWRMAGALISVATPFGGPNPVNGRFGNGERGYFQNCLFQGFRGFAIRGMDRIKVIANTTSTFTVPWDPSFHWSSETQLRLFGSGGTQTISFTGYTFDSGAETVTFTGCTPAITGTSFEANITPGSNGLSFFTMVDCYAAGLEHSSGLRADQLGLGVSAPFEISGAQIRQPYLVRLKAQTHEASGGIFHDCLNVRMPGFQSEGGSLTELRASPSDSSPRVWAPYQRGSTDDLRMADALISVSTGTTHFDPRGCYFDRGVFQTEGITDTDNPMIFKNWRVGPGYFSGDSGTRFLKVPASDAALQDLTITSDSYGLTTTATDVNLQMKGSANFSVRNASNVVTAKVLQSGRFEFTNVMLPSADQGGAFGSAANRASDVRAMRAAFSGPIQPGQFTLATLPSASGFTGYEIDVTDATGGSKRCRSNGSVWQILNTTTTVS